MYKDEEKKFDIRVVEKYIQEGSITREEFKAHLKNLPDVSSNLDDEYHFEFSRVHKRAERESPPSPPEQSASSPEDEQEA